MLRLHASLTDIDRFDIHRSRFPLTQRFSALQQSRLLRYSDVNTGAIEGDLAEAWETPDDESYVLLLRRGVRWWPRHPTEGRAFTAEDVRANIGRQIAGLDGDGNPDPLFLRKAQFTRTRAVDVVDDLTVVLRTDGPVGSYMASVVAGPWSFLQAPEAWEAYGAGLRDGPLDPGLYTGTGGFQMQRLIPEGLAAFGANDGYFRDARPHLLAIEFAHLPTAAGQEAAYRDGDIDIWSPGDPAADRRRARRPARRPGRGAAAGLPDPDRIQLPRRARQPVRGPPAGAGGPPRPSTATRSWRGPTVRTPGSAGRRPGSPPAGRGMPPRWGSWPATVPASRPMRAPISTRSPHRRPRRTSA